MAELKPCPFCGGKAILNHGLSGTQFSYVHCTRCFAKTSDYYISTAHSSDRKAIEAWNRRAGGGNG